MKFGRWFLLLILVAGMSRASLALFQESGASELLKTADEMIQTVARIRGLEPKGPILRGVKSREEISRFLNELVQKEYVQSELQKEGKILQKLGLIPASMDFKEFLLKLLGEQAEGFYDPGTKTLYIASWAPSDEQKPVMAHEITHALQDQYFDIGKTMKEDRALGNDDRALAHEAVREGDGMAVMLNYLLEPAQKNFAQLPDLITVMRAQMSVSQSRNAVFESAPQYIQENLLFSYGYGAAFLQKIWARDPSWKSIDKLYQDPPSSTEQILHPEKYFAHDNPKPVQEENIAAKLGNNWRVSYKNVLGEFSLGLLMNLRFTETRARRVVNGWGGDEVLLLENAQGKDAVYVNTIWDSAGEADVFFAAMQDWLRQRYPKATKMTEISDRLSLVQDGEFHSLQRDGTSIRFIIGLPEPDGLKLFPGEPK
jgi:hypothetical protein